MKHVFGPVYSRRLGQSLGVDLVPMKTCNWNCVYCQLGRTSNLTNTRKNYIDAEEVLRQLAEALQKHRAKKIDWISFVGSGEPTLHSRLGWMIREVKSLTELPVAAFTNGSLLCQPDVAHDLMDADAVLPSFNVGFGELFSEMHRPHPDLTFEKHVAGLESYRRLYHGKLWVEVMLVKDLNDSDFALQQTWRHLEAISPDEIHLSVPTRPPSESWVRQPSQDRLVRACEILGPKVRLLRAGEAQFDLSGEKSVIDAILAIIGRHPMRHDELLEMLNAQCDLPIDHVLGALEASGRTRAVIRNGVQFWSSAEAKHAD